MTKHVQLVCQSSIESNCQLCSSPESSAITPGCLPQQCDECQCICEDHCYCPKELRCSTQPKVSDMSLHVCISFKAFAARLRVTSCVPAIGPRICLPPEKLAALCTLCIWTKLMRARTAKAVLTSCNAM